MKTLLVNLILFALLTASPLAIYSQTVSGDWNSLKQFQGSDVAIKKNTGETIFGNLREITDSSIRIQVISKSTAQEAIFEKSDIEKIWKAKIRFGRNTGKGALIGGAAGAAIGIGAVVANNRSSEPDGQAGVAVPVFGIIGAGLGGLVGFATRNRPSKGKVIYSR